MYANRTIKILTALAIAALSGCQLWPPRTVFIRPISLGHPENPHALFIEGKALLAQGEARKAALKFQAALALQPDFEEARIGLAHAHRRGRNYRRAEALYRQVLERAPQNVAALEGLAVCERYSGRPDQARAHFQQALALDPKSVSTLNAYADFLYNRKEYAEALKHWEESLRLDPSQGVLRELVADLRRYVAKYGAGSQK